jgi:hypothetical protein
MRSFCYLSVAVAALGLVLSAPHAEAITNTAPAGIRAGMETLDVIEPVHCRRFRHGHRYGHGWSRGCRVGVVVAPARRTVVIRERGGLRRGTTVRARTTIRTPDPASQINIRSGDRPAGVNTNIRTGGDPSTSNTTRSGMGNNPSPGTSTTTTPAASTGTGRTTAPSSSQ